MLGRQKEIDIYLRPASGLCGLSATGASMAICPADQSWAQAWMGAATHAYVLPCCTQGPVLLCVRLMWRGCPLQVPSPHQCPTTSEGLCAPWG